MQKTAATPYFDSSAKSILRIPKNMYNKELYELFDKNLEVALQKSGSGAKTRTVRQILDIVYMGYAGNVLGGGSVSSIPVYGVFIGDQNLLAGIIIDVIKCSPDSKNDLVKYFKESNKLRDELVAAKRHVDDKAVEKIHNIEKKYSELFKMIAASIDYTRVIEAIYFNYIRYIITAIDQGKSHVLFELSSDLFKEIIKKVFGSALNGLDDKDIKLLFDAAIDYIFTVSFLDFSPAEVIRNIAKRYNKDIAGILDNSGIRKAKSMENVAHVLDAIKVLRTNPIAFNSAISKYMGNDVLTIMYGTYDYYVAWAVLTHTYSTLFNMGPIDKNIQGQMETIVLNYKSKVRLANKSSM
jgi:uncharacterized membrane protein (DUF106 family)